MRDNDIKEYERLWNQKFEIQLFKAKAIYFICGMIAGIAFWEALKIIT